MKGAAVFFRRAHHSENCSNYRPHLCGQHLNPPEHGFRFLPVVQEVSRKGSHAYLVIH